MRPRANFWTYLIPAIQAYLAVLAESRRSLGHEFFDIRPYAELLQPTLEDRLPFIDPIKEAQRLSTKFYPQNTYEIIQHSELQSPHLSKPPRPTRRRGVRHPVISVKPLHLETAVKVEEPSRFDDKASSSTRDPIRYRPDKYRPPSYSPSKRKPSFSFPPYDSFNRQRPYRYRPPPYANEPLRFKPAHQPISITTENPLKAHVVQRYRPPTRYRPRPSFGYRPPNPAVNRYRPPPSRPGNRYRPPTNFQDRFDRPGSSSTHLSELPKPISRGDKEEEDSAEKTNKVTKRIGQPQQSRARLPSMFQFRF